MQFHQTHPSSSWPRSFKAFQRVWKTFFISTPWLAPFQPCSVAFCSKIWAFGSSPFATSRERGTGTAGMYLKAGQGRLRQAKVPIFKKKKFMCHPSKNSRRPFTSIHGLGSLEFEASLACPPKPFPPSAIPLRKTGAKAEAWILGFGCSNLQAISSYYNLLQPITAPPPPHGIRRAFSGGKTLIFSPLLPIPVLIPAA